MQPTKRIYPGGQFSPSHPLDEIPEHARKVNFRRKVLSPRKQIQTQDAIGTKDVVAAPEEDNTEEEVVEGELFKWAGNICHLEDTKVKVEDLSDRNIDPGLAQSTQELLSKVLKCDARKMTANTRSEQSDELTTEEFTIFGPLGAMRVHRKTYHDLDARNGLDTQYPKLATAKRISEEAEAKTGPAPSDAQVKRVACRILAERSVGLDNSGSKINWPQLLREAHEMLYKRREDTVFQSELNDELTGASERPANLTHELVELVEKKLFGKRSKENAFHNHMLDTEASHLCERIEGFDIVILRDKKHELICGMVTEAVQKLFPTRTVDKMSTAAEAFAWRYPFKKSDDLRHPTCKAVYLAAHPWKDVRSTECEQPHLAVCGVEHYGVHHETGRSSGFNGLCFERLGYSRCNRLVETNAWKEEFPKLRGGVYGVAAKVSTLALEAWDRRLYEDYLEVRRHLPDSLKMTLTTTCENPYGYMAQLVDKLTEGHTDKTDWFQGLAALTCFGDFSGGDLVLKELGVRISFPSGSNCHLRGQTLHHMVSSYEGMRHCLVLTNKESVRKTIRSLDERLEQETDRATQLGLRDAKDWSDDEQKLHEAYTAGKSSMLEHTWSLIKNEVQEHKVAQSKARQAQADKSKEDKSKEDKSKEDKSKEDKSKEDKSKEDKSKEDKSKEDKSKEDHPEEPPRKKARKSREKAGA